MDIQSDGNSDDKTQPFGRKIKSIDNSEKCNKKTEIA